METVSVEEIIAEIERFGFDVVLQHELDDVARAGATTNLRGGNWGAGPFPRSGGEPVHFLLAVHYQPTAPAESLLRRFPHLTNTEAYEAKTAIRRLVDSRTPERERFNALHSSDNSNEALEYLQVAVPDRVTPVKEEIVDRVSRYTVPETVTQTLNRGRRARVDLVESPLGPRVRKTYAPAFTRFKDREMTGIRTLRNRVDALPEVLEEGANWYTMPYYHNALGPMKRGDTPRLLPLAAVREMVAVLKQLYEYGYDVVDARPWNFILDESSGLKIIDLEFLYEYENDKPPFHRTANFIGPWEGFSGDIPIGNTSYEWRWLPYTGLSAPVLAYGSPGRQHVHRALYRMRRATLGPDALPTRGVRKLRAALRHVRWLVARRLENWSRERGRSGLQSR